MKKVRLTLSAHWQLLVLLFVSGVALCFTYLFRLGSLTNRRLSHGELASHIADESIHAIVRNPINAPYKLLDYVFLKFNIHDAGYARLASVSLALLAGILFFIIMLRWHGKRTAILATTLFCTSSWLLHIGRLANGDATLIIVPLAFILFTSWLNVTEKHGLALLYMTVATGVTLLIPGGIWFLIASYILIWKAILNHLAHSRVWEKTVSIIALLGFALFLCYVFYKRPILYKSWLGLPSIWPSLLTILKHWLDTVVFTFARGPYVPAMWLAHTPIFDVFTAAMCIVGIIFYVTHYKNLRTRALLTFLILGSLLVALNGATAMSYVIPSFYLIVGTGIAYFLHKWLSVFPRNPIARGLGIGLLSMVVAFAAVYHLTNYFIAWRYNPETISSFHARP